MERVDFTLGEKKYVCISVTSTNGRPFDISRARYRLKNGDEEEAAGECVIEQICDQTTVLSALIQPQIKCATYTLEYEYEISPEILKYEVKVKVS